MARCNSSWGALLCVLGIYALVGVAAADVLPRAEKALTEANAAKNAAARCEYAAERGEAEAVSAADKADFAKTRDECRLIKNDGARAETPMKRLIERAKAPPPQPDPDPAPTDPSPPPQDPEPQPEPDPVPSDPSPPASESITIDGVRLLPVALGSIKTPTGTWPVDSLGTVGDGRAYLFRLASRPDWWSICITRAPDGDGLIDERAYQLSGISGELTIRVLPGSMKCADNGEPVAPSMERLRKAVGEKRVLPYSAAAFAGWPKAAPSKVDRTTLNALGYKPDRIYGKSASASALPWTISAAGGEYETSRGFIASSDSQMIAAAVDGVPEMFAESAKKAGVETLYGLSIPNLAIWSNANDMPRDPQIPLPGDRPYVNEGSIKGGDQYGAEGEWCAPADYPYLAEIEAAAGKCYAHGNRDESHLFNHGYAYWLATGDPRAAILQQAIAAYALASVYQGAYSDGRYRARFGYQRATINVWSAAWKLRDVALHASGPLLWPKDRALKMAGDVITDWERQIAAVDAGTDASSVMLRLLGAIDNQSGYGISNFMSQIYGPEAAYLWASAGRPKMLERLARQMVVRFGLIGGTRGVYGTASGSAFGARATDGGPITYSTVDGLVAYVNASSPYPADSFDGAAQHTVMRGYWLLKLAQDAERRGWIAPVAGVSAAIARMEAARAAKAPTKDLSVVDWKHAAVPFE